MTWFKPKWILDAAIIFAVILIVFFMVQEAQAQPGTIVNWNGDLFWDEVTEDVNGNPVTPQGYNAYKGVTSGPYTKLNSSLISVTSFNDPIGGLNDCYVVTAVSTVGLESIFSDEACIVPPRKPFFLRFLQAIVTFIKNLFSLV